MATATTQILKRARLTWQRSPLPGFLRWWGGELTAMLPARLRMWLRRGPEVLWLSVNSSTAGTKRVRTGALLATIPSELPVETQRAVFMQACAGTDPDDRRLLLVVPAAQVLHRRLLMPMAAATDPHRVVGYELDRQTPFKPDQVYYDVRVSSDPAPAGQVLLDVYVTPKGELDPMLERLAMIGAHPDAVDVQKPDDTLVGVDLLPADRRPQRVDKRGRINWILGAACIVLVALMLSQWLDNRRAALANMQDEVDAMRTRATQAEQLRAQLIGAVGASRFLVKHKSATPTPLAVLDDLTTRLPSSAWLDTFTLDGSGGLDIKGEADKAAALVDRLGASPLLSQPQLQGVIQPDVATHKERFELVARVRGESATDAH